MNLMLKFLYKPTVGTSNYNRQILLVNLSKNYKKYRTIKEKASLEIIL